MMTRPVSNVDRSRPVRWKGFTLIELMAVTVVIVVLIGLVLGLASTIQKRMNVGTTKAAIATIAMALDSYRSDWGYYPVTTAGRISANGYWEATNNWILWRALAGVDSHGVVNRKKYMNFPSSMVHSNLGGRSLDGGTTVAQYWTNSAVVFSPLSSGLTNIYDAFGMPLNYYNSPTTPFAMINNSITGTNYTCIGYTVGGQVNVSTYDLFSYGSDRMTYVPGANGAGYTITNNIIYPWVWPSSYGSFSSTQRGWPSPNAASDDITNWGR